MVIDHGHGLITSYSHLSEVSVKEGQFIDKGQKLVKLVQLEELQDHTFTGQSI